MAKFEVSGKSIQDLLSMDGYELRSLSIPEFRSVITRLVSAANKRIKRFSPVDNAMSPAIRALAKSMGLDADKGEMPRITIGQISKGGEDERNQLHNTYIRVKNFLDAKTSTAKGFADYRSKVRDKIGNANIFQSPDFERAFWDGYNRFMTDQHMKVIWTSNAETGYNKVLVWLRNEVQDVKDVTAENIYELLRTEYERMDIEDAEKFSDIKTPKAGEISVTGAENSDASKRSAKKGRGRGSRRRS